MAGVDLLTGARGFGDSRRPNSKEKYHRVEKLIANSPMPFSWVKGERRGHLVMAIETWLSETRQARHSS